MECGICSEIFGPRRKPTCASCSRAQIYTLRHDQITSLLAKEKLHGTIKALLQSYPQLQASQITTASRVVDLIESSRKLEYERQDGQIQSIDAKIGAIKLQQDRLRQQIVEAREENAARKKEHARTRDGLRAAKSKLKAVSDSQLLQVDADCKRLEHRLEKVQKHTISGRQKLCMETAFLFGVRRKKSRAINGVMTPDAVYIGKLPIPDLRELNTIHPDTINASLSHITRLLATTSHYLGVRLPAEVVAPHAGRPHPGIFSLHSSYHDKVGKLRHLFISKPLPLLAKEDVPIYNNFVDGLILLAYDIAWLCRTQGLLDIDTLQGMCAMGPNIYNLFLADHRHNRSKDEHQLRLGEFSHANSFADQTRHHVASLLANWRLPSLTSMVDNTKSHLLTEMSGAEWELLDEKEWEEEREDERAVLVGGARWSLSTGAASRMGVSYMTAAQDVDDEHQKDDSTRGWMKLKVRSGETQE